MDSISAFGTNGMQPSVGASSNHNDFFHMFHNFLGMFHHPDRTGIPEGSSQQDLPGLLGGVFPGLNQKFNDFQSMGPALNAAGLGQAFGLGQTQ